MNHNVIELIFQVSKNGELGKGEEAEGKIKGKKEMTEERRMEQRE